MNQTVEQVFKDIWKNRDHLMPGASESDATMFAQVCARSGLDPFTRQIYAIARKSRDRSGNWITKWQIQASIDGLRAIAERSGAYEGQTATYWCGKDGKWVDVWLSDDYPMAAKVGVFKKDHREANWAVAKFRSYCQTDRQGKATAMWAKMPEIMIGKCAESLALRKAFPNELSGLYTTEEMQQVDNPKTAKVDPAPAPTKHKTERDLERFERLKEQSGTPDAAIEALLKRHQVTSVGSLPQEVFDKTLLRFEELIQKAGAV